LKVSTTKIVFKD